MDLGSDLMIDETDSTDVEQAEKFDVIYSCLRCAVKVSNSELSLLPEIKWF